MYPVYKSPNINIDTTLKDLNDIILHHSSLKKAEYKIILEDLNIDMLKPSKIKDECLILMMHFGSYPIIKDITRPASNSCIDHIFRK